MKKILILMLCFISIICFSGCNNQSTPDKTKVTINLPKDNTVNGYRNEQQKMPDKINAQTILPNTDTQSISYCGNKNSKKFHKISCSSLNNTKDENKVYFKSRENYLEKGYTACKKCDP